MTKVHNRMNNITYLVKYTWIHARMSFTNRHAEIVLLPTRRQRRVAECVRRSQWFRRLIPAKTVAGCGAKARDWSTRAAAAARAQGRRFSREQCQMVHLSRWVRSPPTPGAARSAGGHSPQHSLASRRSKVDGRQPSAYFTPHRIYIH